MNTEPENAKIRLTQYSHGAGCGCKIAPKVLDQIVQSNLSVPMDSKLLVGNSSKDDAAAYDLGNGMAVLSTTDFFMPIADDPFDFGRIAATNAISDIFAMGGKPMMAIAILGWPLNKLGPEVARQVVEGGRQACLDAGIMLAGGHSIDSPEPIFGLAVTGQVPISQLKQNNTAQAGCRLYLTKPLGVGVLTTAQKQGKLKDEHSRLAIEVMCQMNSIGSTLAAYPWLTAMTDVTGFGLLGHLLELCEGSGLRAQLWFEQVPKLAPVMEYIQAGAVPGGSQRNFDSYGHKISALAPEVQALLCDPQTSGGLLLAVSKDAESEVQSILQSEGLYAKAIGELLPAGEGPLVEVI
ncbi:selenide, water dikinase SelD [Aliiglaciecola sp. CAU 1673]|uniref:selenide, water dikinase SelD n=1 Tax=Aliiglaciecola sp. CAU 1673 TaxID=3032595 RepID=UPI0023DA9BF7|nr:selenide, water dikinase SelD [Aliiglaciecola sp. CAU 1673]MDF2176665.1 selenide, water dikinase SelD [Aliiglaciecola sp. CAU 1673]